MKKEIKHNKNTSKKEIKNKQAKEKLIPGIKKELKLVKWPKAKEIFKYTIATILFCIIVVLFFELLNILMAYVKGLFN